MKISNAFILLRLAVVIGLGRLPIKLSGFGFDVLTLRIIIRVKFGNRIIRPNLFDKGGQ